jgi:hypothetical protein
MTRDERRHRGRLLFVVLTAIRLRFPPETEPAIVATLLRWLDSWSSIGLIATGMARQGYDLQLTRYGDEGWRATFYPAGRAHSRRDPAERPPMTLVWSGQTYHTDKDPALIALYDRVLDPRRDEAIVLLELGVGRGGSLLFWRDYFPRGVVVGLDVEPVRVADPFGRVHVYQGRQEDVDLLDRIAAKMAPDGFTVVIDDASHLGALTGISLWHLFRHHLRPGGVYALENWGTGYWDG